MKKNRNILFAAMLSAAVIMAAGCGQQAAESAEAGTAGTEAAGTSAAAPEAQTTEAAANTETSENAETAANESAEADEETAYIDDTLLRVASLKGPTTMGLVNMMAENEAEALPFKAEFTMAAAADEITAKVASGDVDIALVPANLASVLYNRTEGGVSVVDINTLGVLYGVTGDESIKSLSDLKGRTVYMTGQGSTPEYAVSYILAQNGLSDDVTLEFKSEATEVAALLSEDPSAIAILPQPFATVAMKQNEALKEFLNLTDEWKKCADSGNSELVTGVTIVRNAFLREHEALVAEFVLEHQESALKANEDLDTTAELVAKYGIIEKAPIAKLALPKCNIVCITGAEMKDALQGYLSVLFNAEPKSVGGALPADDFYAFVEAD
ncbi:MAG: ABC transporter substrate-binding protein [Eubacteriales bacterium]|nr:ABC transporter substrate-binding protein [Eubacteriales bacterium]